MFEEVDGELIALAGAALAGEGEAGRLHLAGRAKVSRCSFKI